jgi:hypothetical protein
VKPVAGATGFTPGSAGGARGNGFVLWQHGRVPMRQDCKNFESRTYPNGETVRKCNVDLAPEAPWKCPDDCTGYERRLADVNWKHGTLVTPPTPDEPVGEGIAELLDEAEEIVNSAGPQIVAEVRAEKQRQQSGGPIRRVRDRFRRKR